ncbi:DUF6279 family lipoprotein [Motiliproteus sp. MSK22-1]|uniref:DUF6279 family lipoprotein n=1 Tax=Motiliproteus sp. MSK22-1 TaxID=1897630 RepID=UPI00097773F3|nr:DUF6279 family lipoprotein [Motiliproteus sp. MSK22-1]OMH25752.1 hypothetical protein BGP75_24810 [Motiliproteus sp. MSK22-1]
MRDIRPKKRAENFWRCFSYSFRRTNHQAFGDHLGTIARSATAASLTPAAPITVTFPTRVAAALRTIVVLMFLLLSAGCSSRFIYNNLDWLAYWFVDDYVDFHLEQKELFSPKIEQLLVWHRAKALPEYLQLLTEIQASVAERNLQSEQLAQWLEQAKTFWQEMILQSEPLILTAAESADEKQIAQLLRNLRTELEEKQQEAEKDLRDKNQSRRQKKLERSYEKWLGPLSDSQKGQIQELIKHTRASRQQWLEYRRRWVDELEIALNSAKEEGEFQSRLKQLIRNPYELRSSEYKANLEADRLLWIERLPALINQVSDKQHAHLLGELDELSADIRHLIEQGG